MPLPLWLVYLVSLLVVSSILIIFFFLKYGLGGSCQLLYVPLPCKELSDIFFLQKMELNWTLAKKGKWIALCSALFSSLGICNSHKRIYYNNVLITIFWYVWHLLYMWSVCLIVCEYDTLLVFSLSWYFLKNNHILRGEASRCYCCLSMCY